MRSISASTRAISASAAGVSAALGSGAPRASPPSVAMIVTAVITNASVQRALVISNLHSPNSGGTSIGYAPAEPRCETGQPQRVASMLRAKPAKGAPNVVGTPAIVGTPLWVVAHVAVLGDVARGADGLESGLVPRGISELVTGADGFGLSETDGGLMPPLPSSVEPSGIPAGPTDEPGPNDEARGGGAVADAAQASGALAAIPPPSKSAGLDSPGIEPAMPADAPVIGPPTPADTPADEAPAHVAPITGDAPDVIGLTPGVASSIAPRGIPVCPTGAFGMPSGDVMPSAGRGETFMRACAWAEAQPKRTAAVATAKRVIIATTFFHLGIR